ncbi:hypothetical protein [Archangium sp.]|uniref:hypothetical protein n=1 Tax=Archangium sp. TaxID=1872627 RepID=UPI00389A089B
MIASIEAQSGQDPECWTFAGGSRREEAHAYFQYPAMMVPSVQRKLIASILQLQSNITSVLDPFAGSGTILVEAMIAGLSVRAQDINPLAVLLCKAKAGPLNNALLHKRVHTALTAAREDRSTHLEAHFPNRRKWLRDCAAIDLSRLKRAIGSIEERWVRRFLWVSLAETIRLTSNSRTSTYKLHIRPREQIPTLARPLDVFRVIAERNLAKHLEFATRLKTEDSFQGTPPVQSADIRLRDSRLPIDGQYDLLVTSPPYGDNQTTVPYGQSAYLPLQWVDFKDIDTGASSEDFLSSTHEIDRQSLGGERARGNLRQQFRDLLERSPSLDKTLRKLELHPKDRSSRVVTFISDLDVAIQASFAALKHNAYSIWTLGNRRVGGIEVPLDAITTELVNTHGGVRVTSVVRQIRSKRMAIRNSVAPTMHHEHIIIFRSNKRAPLAR